MNGYKSAPSLLLTRPSPCLLPSPRSQQPPHALRGLASARLGAPRSAPQPGCVWRVSRTSSRKTCISSSDDGFKPGKVTRAVRPFGRRGSPAGRGIIGRANRQREQWESLKLDLNERCILGYIAFAGYGGVLLGGGDAAWAEEWLEDMGEVWDAAEVCEPTGSPVPFVLGAMACVLLAGLMSGLTLGLMSLSLVELEILARSGTETEREQVGKVMPIVQKGHQLLVTLLLCNALAMEALPLFLDQLVDPFTAILLSVSLVLAFGEVPPQAAGSKYGLEVGAMSAPFVRVLLQVCSPVAWPMAKGLDAMLGSNHIHLYRRTELKVLMDLEVEQGELSLDENLIISGAMGLVGKTVECRTRPLSNTFMLSQDAVLDVDTVDAISDSGVARVPVHAARDTTEVLGLLPVKNLIVLNPQDATPVSMLPLIPLKTVPVTEPLHAMLNLFQSTGVHTALVAGEDGTTVGIITLTDVMEELLQEPILNMGSATNEQYAQYVMDVEKARAYATFVMKQKQQILDEVLASWDEAPTDDRFFRPSAASADSRRC